MKQLFYIGQTVICINDDFSWARRCYSRIHSWPIKGERYRVRDYVCDGKWPALTLRELHNPLVVYHDGKIREAGFWDQRFIAAPLPDEINVIIGNKNQVTEWSET